MENPINNNHRRINNINANAYEYNNLDKLFDLDPIDFNLIVINKNPTLIEGLTPNVNIYSGHPQTRPLQARGPIFDDNYNNSGASNNEGSRIDNDLNGNVVGGDGTNASPIHIIEDRPRPFCDPLLEVVYAGLPSITTLGDDNRRGPAAGRSNEGEGYKTNMNAPRPEGENLVPTLYVEEQKTLIVPTEMNPLNCVGCNLLREIIHTDEEQKFFTKLDLHGRLGVICHAILETRNANGEHKLHKFDFSQNSIDQIGQFLQRYCDDRFNAGYIMKEDPYAKFYQTLSTGFDWIWIDEDDLFDDTPSTSPTDSSNKEKGKSTLSPNSLVQQKKRISKVPLEELASFFHQPIREVAKNMNCCPAAVKKLCRKYGIGRWPYRQIKRIQKEIDQVQQALDSSQDRKDRARAEAKIKNLGEEMARTCTVVTKTSLQ